MSVPSPSHVFESGLQAPSLTSGHLDSLIRQQLDIATNDIAMTSDTPSPMPVRTSSDNSLLNEMGEYLTRTANIWAQLTENLARGPHIDKAAREVHKQAQRHTGLSDLTAITQLDMDHGKLCKIRDLTAQYSRDVQQIWSPKPSTEESSTRPSSGIISPFCDIKPFSVPRTFQVSEDKASIRRTLPSSQQEQTSPLDDGSGSEGSEDDGEEHFSRLDMEALRTRGKGNHYCPKGYQCTKGGVDKEGKLVVFDRNSSFVQHCNKHRKPYRCNLEGCPNPAKKRRFARRDGLERHQRSVAHMNTHSVA